jgi:transcriptional regulator with XRE-family HTH domain
MRCIILYQNCRLIENATSMQMVTEPIAEALREARRGRGLSQHALSRLTGVPQSHISRIESGAVDLRLSSLIELARTLDLEVVVVPRRSVGAVQSIADAVRRSIPTTAPTDAETARPAYTLDDDMDG